MLAGFEEPEPPPAADSAAPTDPSPTDQPPELAGKKVFVVDAHNLIFQVFHAMPEMTGPQGQPVNAVFGFVRDLFLLIDDYAPDFLICAFDLPGPTFRHEIYDAYKEDREEMPDDLRPQIASIRRMLTAMRVPAVGLSGYEADDVMATLAHTVAEAGADCVLVTGDKDCRQLINDRVKLLQPSQGRIV